MGMCKKEVESGNVDFFAPTPNGDEAVINRDDVKQIINRRLNHPLYGGSVEEKRQDAALLLAVYDDGKEIKRNAASLIRAQQSLELVALVIWVLIVGFTWALRTIQPQAVLNPTFHGFCLVINFFATVYAFVRVAFLVYPDA